MKVLIIEDDPGVRLGLSCTLEKNGYKITSVENGLEGIKLFENEGFDIVVTDLRLPGVDGIKVLKSVRDISPDTGVIIITAFADVETAVEAMKEGAYDYISKPFNPEELLIVIEKFIKYRGIELENIRLKEELKEKKQFQQIIAISPAMQKIFETIETVAKTDSSVVIYGESGTGKELVANAIHNLSPRKDKPFLKINCAAIPETLLESELFGHEKGAFTGAVHRKKGKFEVADGGTIFFDEISEMPLSIQAKMLRVIENHIFERIGGTESIHVDVRTIYATGRDLKDEVKAERFREDLYYRLNVIPINLPPLRERREDIPLLIEHFLKIFKEKVGKPNITISHSAMERLLSYNYPGNVRELKHAIETAVTLCKSNMIEPCCLLSEIGRAEMEHAIPLICNDDAPLTERIKAFEREIIAHVLEETEGKKKRPQRNLESVEKHSGENSKNMASPNPFLI